MNPTTVCLQQMLSGEYQCSPFRPEVTNAGSQRPLGPFTSRIKILLAKRFAITQNTPTHSFTAALQQPTYRRITIHTHQSNKLLLFKIYYLTSVAIQKRKAGRNNNALIQRFYYSSAFVCHCLQTGFTRYIKLNSNVSTFSDHSFKKKIV
jgi:hypothetical protein